MPAIKPTFVCRLKEVGSLRGYVGFRVEYAQENEATTNDYS